MTGQKEEYLAAVSDLFLVLSAHVSIRHTHIHTKEEYRAAVWMNIYMYVRVHEYVCMYV